MKPDSLESTYNVSLSVATLMWICKNNVWRRTRRFSSDFSQYSELERTIGSCRLNCISLLRRSKDKHVRIFSVLENFDKCNYAMLQFFDGTRTCLCSTTMRNRRVRKLSEELTTSSWLQCVQICNVLHIPYLPCNRVAQNIRFIFISAIPLICFIVQTRCRNRIKKAKSTYRM